MKLYEFEAKKILKSENISIPAGILITPRNIGDISKLPAKDGLILKGQILSGGRKKSGAIEAVKTGLPAGRYSEEAKTTAEQLLNKEVVSAQNGERFRINAILAEEIIPHEREIYLSFVFDRDSENITLLAGEGGIEIEETGKNDLIKIEINPFLGISKNDAKNAAEKLNIESPLWEIWSVFLKSLWLIFTKYDALLLEINPLIISGDSEFVCLDAKMIIDENAVARQPKILEFERERLSLKISPENDLETKAKKIGVGYVKLKNGDIGCVVNGAGLAMATMDLLKFHFGSPANFLDVGGGARKEKISQALELIFEDKDVSVIFINILGGILRCDILAEAVCETIEKTKTAVPIIARLAGTNAEEAKKILEQSGKLEKNIWLFDDLDTAARIAAQTAKLKFAAKKSEEIFRNHSFFKEIKNGDTNK